MTDARKAKMALPWVMFYRDGKNLGEIAAKLGGTVYDYSPWLTAPMTQGLMRELNKIEKLTATLAQAKDALTHARESIDAVDHVVPDWAKEESAAIHEAGVCVTEAIAAIDAITKGTPDASEV